MKHTNPAVSHPNRGHSAQEPPPPLSPFSRMEPIWHSFGTFAPMARPTARPPTRATASAEPVTLSVLDLLLPPCASYLPDDPFHSHDLSPSSGSRHTAFSGVSAHRLQPFTSASSLSSAVSPVRGKLDMLDCSLSTAAATASASDIGSTHSSCLVVRGATARCRLDGRHTAEAQAEAWAPQPVMERQAMAEVTATAAATSCPPSPSSVASVGQSMDSPSEKMAGEPDTQMVTTTATDPTTTFATRCSTLSDTGGTDGAEESVYASRTSSLVSATFTSNTPHPHTRDTYGSDEEMPNHSATNDDPSGFDSGKRTQPPSATSTAAASPLRVIDVPFTEADSTAVPALFSTNPFILRSATTASQPITDGHAGAPLFSTSTAAALAVGADALVFHGDRDAFLCAAATAQHPANGAAVAEGTTLSRARQLPNFFQSAARLLPKLLPSQTRKMNSTGAAAAAVGGDELGLSDFLFAFFVDEEWFTKEALLHSLCLLNRLTKARPSWWSAESAPDAATSPVVIMPSEREGNGAALSEDNDTCAVTREDAATSAAAALFTRASLPRALLALLLLSSKFVDDVTYNTESICGVMAKLRQRQTAARTREKREEMMVAVAATASAKKLHMRVPERELDEMLAGAVDSPIGKPVGNVAQVLLARGTRRPSTVNMSRQTSVRSLSPASSCTSVCSLENTSTNSSVASVFAHGSSSVAVYPVLKPARLGQCEQRMFKLLNHSVWVKGAEIGCCKTAMRAQAI